MRARTGITFTDNGHRIIRCVVTGEMSDGRKVWTECDDNKNPVNMDIQYYLLTGGNWSEFIKV